MELANMLLNQLTERSSSMDINKKQSITNQGFMNFLDSAKNNVNNKTYSNIEKNDDFFKKQEDANKKNEIKSEDTKSEETKLDDGKLEEVNEKEIKLKDNSTDETEELSKVIIFDEKVLNQLSEILGIKLLYLMKRF